MGTSSICEDTLIVEIQEDVKQYIRRHRKMPISYAVTRDQMKRLKELKQEGQEPKVVFRGEEYKVPVNEMWGV